MSQNEMFSRSLFWSTAAGGGGSAVAIVVVVAIRGEALSARCRTRMPSVEQQRDGGKSRDEM